MMHPLLRLVVNRPGLLVDHMESYGDLLASEAAGAIAGWRQRAMLHAVTLCALCIGVILAGAALMLWATLSTMPDASLWVLVAVPLPPLVVALACWLAARKHAPFSSFALIRSQLAADASLLREIKPS